MSVKSQLLTNLNIATMTDSTASYGLIESGAIAIVEHKLVLAVAQCFNALI